MKSNVLTDDLTPDQKAGLVTDIQKLDEHGMELIAALIRAHQIETTIKRVDTSLPYNSMTDGDHMMFDLESLPIPLKHVISKFVKVHVTSMKESRVLAIARTP